MKLRLRQIETWNFFPSSKFIWLLLTLALFAASRVEAAGPAAGDTIADGVLGQSDFVQHGANGIDGASFSGPTNGPDDVLIDTQATPHRLWLSDESNHRVLGWENIDALTNGAPADVVVGQPDFFSNGVNAGGKPSASGLNRPHGLAVDSMHNLYVADTYNNRVLVFTDPFAIKAHTGQTGDFSAFMVFGQAGNLTSNLCNFGASSPNAESLCFPVGVKLDKSDNLWVTDNGNNRILAFFIPLLTDAVADLVIGQNGLFENGRCSEATMPSARTLCGPGLLTFDEAGNLFVTDEGNSRALEYPFSSATGLPDRTASRVFGQNGSFGTDLPSSVETGFNSPYGISFDNSGNLFIADRLNNRVLEFTPPFDASPVPVAVFGQAGDFTSHACNKNSSANTASDRSLCEPAGVESDTNGNLWISDQNNSRLLRFTPPFGLNPRANLVLGQGNFVNNQPNSVDSTNYNSQPIGIAVDRSSVPDRLYVADTKNNRVLGYSDNLFTTDTNNNRVLQYLQPYAEPTVLSQSTTAMPFGTVAVGTKSSAIDVTMTNPGVVPIFIYRITIEGPEAADFTQTNNCVGTLKPTSSCTIAGAFKPSVKAAESATVTVMDNALKAPQHISMSGTGS